MAISTIDTLKSALQHLELTNVPFSSMFNEIVALLLLAVGIGVVALRLRQPLIVGFIAVGILVGPSGLGWVKSPEEIRLLAEIGLSLLLFVVGLRLDPGLIRSMGLVSLATGFGQVALTFAFGYLTALALGMAPVTAVYAAVALTLSSTVIIVKLLSDKRETESLHGRIDVGVLIIQDIVVILAMVALAAFAGTSGGNAGSEAILILTRGISLLAGIALVTYFVIPRVLPGLARSPELLVLTAIAWALAVSSASEALGLSKEVGAFLAGVSLASTEFREIIGARLVSLRDFLLLFFFVDLGMGLNMSALGRQVWAAIPLSLFVLIGKPIMFMVIMSLMGYRKRTGFLAGVSLAQISEFSLILVALGLRFGHIDAGTAGLVTLVGLVTIGLSTYMILYSEVIYERLSPYLGIFERRVPHREQALDASGTLAMRADTILFGLGRYGTGIGNHLQAQGYRILGVDFDPLAVKAWNQRGGTAWFGDAEDPEFPSMLPLSEARWVISAVPDSHVNVALIRALQGHGFRGSIAVTARDSTDEQIVRRCGADVVFVPLVDAASQAVDVVVAVDEQERRRKMDELIADLHDHYVVCGFGRMGQQIARDLQQRDVPFVVIESNPEQLPKLKEQNIPHIVGKASEDKALRAAGIERARGLIAVNPTDEENVFIVLTARGLNPNLFIVARSILQENEDKLRRAGANKVISPYILGGHRMAEAVLRPRAMEFLDLIAQYDHNETELEVVQASERSPFTGSRIEDSRIRETTGALILAIRRANGKRISNPSPETVIEAGDELIVMGTSEQVCAAERLASGA